MTKSEIERLIRAEDIHRWEIAKVIGVHESTLSRWFRADELTEEQTQQVLSAVEQIKQTKARG